MTAKVFVDTNVFVYAFVTDGSDKHARARHFLEALEDDIVVSVQVMNELYVTLLKYGWGNVEIQCRLERLMTAVEVRPLDMKTVDSAWQIRNRCHFSLWDSLVVASAIEAGCRILYTEDLQSGQTIEDNLLVGNPFCDSH
jgi:predicted nucleic acid-binding protein